MNKKNFLYCAPPLPPPLAPCLQMLLTFKLPPPLVSYIVMDFQCSIYFLIEMCLRRRDLCRRDGLRSQGLILLTL